MANPFDSVAVKRRPMFLPGFDRHTQLGMEFNTVRFGAAWLRKQYTNERTRSIQVCLAAEPPYRHERRLQEVRYGNNITLFFKACYTFKAFHSSGSLWSAISRIFGVNSDLAEAIADRFVEARAIYLSNHPPASDTVPLLTTATYWVDKWALYLDAQVPERPPPNLNVFAAVADFFKNERERNGDLSRILSVEPDVDPPTRPRALRKRSPSPSALESAPNAKKRPTSTSVDWTAHQATFDGFKGKEEPRDPMPSPDGHERPDDQPGRIDQEAPYFALKIKGQAQRKISNSHSHQDHHYSELDDYQTLAQSNRELQNRVELLEKERLESIKAQKDRDNAIRALQARFTAFEQTSEVAGTHTSVKDKLVREMQEMAEKLGTQAERLQEMEKQLELSEQTSQSMQATISSLQKDLATATKTNTEQEGSQGTQKGEFSETLVRIASLEAKSVLFNDLHKTVREIKAEVAAQKDKADAAKSGFTNEPNKQDISTRLRTTEEATERQARTIQEAMDRVFRLENQALVRNARITTLEGRPGTAEDILRLKSRLSALDQSQANNLKEVDCRLATMQKRYEQMQEDIKEFSGRLAKLGNLPLVQFLVPEMQTKIAHIEIRGTEMSKRLDDMEVAQNTLTLQDQSSRIDELSKTVESLKSLPFSLAKADDARLEVFRNELESFSQKHIVASQATNQKIDAPTTSMFQSLSDSVKRLDDTCMKHMNECQQRLDQVFGGTGDIVWDGKQSSLSAIVDSLCQRVCIMENGFQIMTDVISCRRR